MSRVVDRDSDGYITGVELPSCVPACEDTLFKINTTELTFDDDYWFDQQLGGEMVIRFPDEVVVEDDVLTAIDLNSGRKTLWSWSAEKGDIIMNGKLIIGSSSSVPAPKPVEDDRCKSCGTMGEIVRMACICPHCGMVVWGC